MERTSNHQLSEIQSNQLLNLIQRNSNNENSYTSARLQWKEFVGSRHNKIEEAAL